MQGRFLFYMIKIQEQHRNSKTREKEIEKVRKNIFISFSF
jgi:hypothetical protein